MHSTLGMVCALGLAVVASAGELRTGDSLNVTCAGAAGVVVHQPSGNKGFADALVYLGFWHPFSDNIFAHVSVKGSESANVPFLHQAAVGWRRNAFSVEGGFLCDRYGAVRMHNSRAFRSRLFDTHVLWDAYGFGVRARKVLGPVTIAGGGGLDNRESGSAHLSTRIQAGPWEGLLLGGFQSYDFYNQDNILTLGGETQVQFRLAGMHLVASYQRHLGYGSLTNPTMRMGWMFDGFVEAFVAPFEELRLSGLVEYRRYRKRYEHSLVYGSMSLEWLPFEWLVPGVGLDITDDDGTVTTAPVLYVEVRPGPERAELRVFVDRRTTGQSTPAYTIGGTIWLDF